VIPSSGGRPTHKECSAKLRHALALFRANRWRPANPKKLNANWEEIESRFGIETSLAEDQSVILEAVLSELSADHYIGQTPPARSYEQATSSHEMFEFAWTSAFFGGTTMYFKLSLSSPGEGQRLYIFSIHPSRGIQ
jgi:hypothetical protein